MRIPLFPVIILKSTCKKKNRTAVILFQIQLLHAQQLDDCLRSSLDAQLQHHIGNVIADGLVRDAQLSGDLAGGAIADQQFIYLAFPRCQYAVRKIPPSLTPYSMHHL